MEYEQPIHIEHETESTDEETENPTEASFRIDIALIGWRYSAYYWLIVSSRLKSIRKSS